MAAGEVAGGIAFDNLWIGCGAEIIQEMTEHGIHLIAQRLCRHDSGREEHIEEDDSPLVLERDGDIGDEVPSRVAQHLLHDSLLEEEVEMAFLIVPNAIETIVESDGEVLQREEEGIEDESVDGREEEGEYDGEFEEGIGDADVGIDIHLLVADDGGVVGDLSDGHETGEGGEVETPYGGGDAVGRDGEFVVDKPEADGLAEQHDEKSQQDVGGEEGGEHRLEALEVAFPEFVGQEPRGPGCQRAVEEGHHPDHAADGGIDTVVLDAEHLEDDA